MSTYRPILQMQGALVNLCRALLQVYTAFWTYVGLFSDSCSRQRGLSPLSTHALI